MSVQVEVAPEFTLVGLQVRPVTSMGATRFKVVVCEEPLSEAVTVALCPVVRVPAVAVKLAEVAAAATVTEAGTVRAVLLLVNATLLPPVGAA